MSPALRVPTAEKARRIDARELLVRLREEIRRHDTLYYVKNRPEISDERYDALYEALVRRRGRSGGRSTD